MVFLTSCGIFDSICLVQGPAAKVQSNSDDEIVPSFQESFVDALAQATENIHIANQGTKKCMNLIKYELWILIGTVGKPGGNRTAKKGRKKMVLFSTGMQRMNL